MDKEEYVRTYRHQRPQRKWFPRTREDWIDVGIVAFGIAIMPPFMATIGGLWFGNIVYGAGKGKFW